MDFSIITAAVFTFIIFLVLHIVIFRILGGEKILNGLVYSILLSTVFHFIWIIFNFNLILFSISLAVALFLIVIYIWGFLGLVTTSLRIQILTEIERMGKKGISHDELLGKYNRDKIIKNRLDRLTESGEIKRIGEFYELRLKLSYFKFHMMFIEILNRLYLKSKYRF